MFVTHLFSNYFGVRGIPEMLTILSLQPLLLDMKVPTAEGQAFSSLVFVPWSMKPLFAATSDLFPVFGYKKRYYMMTVCSVAAFSGFMLGFSSYEFLGGESFYPAFYFYFFIHMSIATCDSCTQGKYTEVCKAKGATIISFVSGSKTLASMLASLIGPPINDVSPKVSVGVTVPFFFQAIICQFMNFMGDEKQASGCSPDWVIMNKARGIIIVGVTLGMLALSVAFIPQLICQEEGAMFECLEWTASDFRFCYVFSVISLIIGLTFTVLPFSVAKINAYMLFCRVMVIDISYPLQGFYTLPASVCQDTPNFPNTVYQMLGNVFSALASLLGVWLFENYVSRWNARPAFWLTTLFTVIAAIFDVNMVTGFNRTIFGFFGDSKVNMFGYRVRLDDMAGFLVGQQALKPVAQTLDDMPATYLLSKLCPVGVETTVFAMLAAMQNLGLTLSGLVGAWFIRLTGIYFRPADYADAGKTIIEGPGVCDRGNGIFGMNGVVWGIVLGGMVLPLLTIPATWALIPNVNLDEDFGTENSASADAEEEPENIFSNTMKSLNFDPEVETQDPTVLASGSRQMFDTLRGGSRLM